MRRLGKRPRIAYPADLAAAMLKSRALAELERLGNLPLCCPRCGGVVDELARICPACGANQLALRAPAGVPYDG